MESQQGEDIAILILRIKINSTRMKFIPWKQVISVGSDPSLNICAGIRWLFHKKKLLEVRLGRRASWEEAAMEYKSYTKGIQNGDKSALKQRDKFFDRYRELKKD